MKIDMLETELFYSTARQCQHQETTDRNIYYIQIQLYVIINNTVQHFKLNKNKVPCIKY